MSILLIICTSLMIVGIILFIVGHIIDEFSVYPVLGLIIILLTGFLGFGLFAATLNYSHKIEQVTIDTLVKSPTILYVELINGKRLEYDTKKEYDEINMNTKIYKVTYFNHYGYELNTEYLLDTTKIE